MKDKTRGFTLIEVIITLAITVIVLGVIYTFSFTSQKMLSSTQINAVLQDDGRDIENSLVDIGMQSKGIKTVNGTETVDASGVGTTKYYGNLLTGKKLQITGEISMIGHDDLRYSFELDGNQLSLIKYGSTTSTKILSKNVDKMEIRPLDINTVTDRANSYFANAPGLEISITLKKKEGLSEITYPVSTIVKFRNKE